MRYFNKVCSGISRMNFIALALVWLLYALPSLAQAIEDPGPYVVGYRDITFTDTNFGRGPVRGRIYYPALSAGVNAPPRLGPYPLTAFQHGYTGAPPDYDALNTHTASWGFVVASIGTETSLAATMQAEAQDTRALLHWVDDESKKPASFLYQMAWDGAWSAAGHSMGGGALMYLIGYEPRVRTIVPLQSYRGPLLGGSSGGTRNLKDFTGSAYFVAGSVDDVVPADTVLPYYQEAQAAGRNVYTLVLGMGHYGPLDDLVIDDPLPAADQSRLHRRFVTGFLRAEQLGQPNLYVDLLGEGLTTEPVQFQTRNRNPILWVAPSQLTSGKLVVGLAGIAGQNSQLGFSLAPAQIPTSFGILGLDLDLGAILQTAKLPSTGVTETLFDPTGYAQGTPLYFQGLAGKLTRVENTLVP